MNALVVIAALVVAAAASDNKGYGSSVYGQAGGYAGYVVPAYGYAGHGGYAVPHAGVGYGHVGHGRGVVGYGKGYGIRYFNDHTGNTVPAMGKDQNNDGLDDRLDSNRDGKADKPLAVGYGYAGVGYGRGTGYGRGAVYAAPAYGAGYAGGYTGYGGRAAGYGAYGAGYGGYGAGGYGGRGYAGHPGGVHAGYYQGGYPALPVKKATVKKA